MHSKILAILSTFVLAIFTMSCECTACRFPPGAMVRITHLNDDGTTSVETQRVGKGDCVSYNCDSSHEPIIRVQPNQL